MTDLILMRVALREALRPRRLILAALLTALPAFIGLLWRLSAGSRTGFDPGDVYDNLEVGLVFGFVLPILSVIYGTGVVAQELEQRTIVYLLTRPLPRWRLLLARFIPSIVVVTAVTILATLILALGVYGPGEFGSAGVMPDIRAAGIGALAYGSLFLLVGAALPRPLVWGLLFVFGWESWVPALPGSFAKISIRAYLRVLASREVVSDPTQAQGADNNFLQSLIHPPQIAIANSTAWIVLLTLSAVTLLAAIFIFSQREYVPREDAE